MRQIVIDADGCPVTRLTVSIAKEKNIPCIIVCDTSHVFDIPEAKVITVEKGADSADFRIVNLLKKDDIVITQDYGPAASRHFCSVIISKIKIRFKRSSARAAVFYSTPKAFILQ